jgi:thioredoxin
MKKTWLLIILIALFFFGCSGTSGSKEGDNSNKTTSMATDSETKTASSAKKPEHLTAQTFKLKVMDYDKNPKQWVFTGDKPCIVDFYADWCRPCRMIAPILEELATEYQGRINIYKVDTDDQKELASVFGIESLPTVLFVPMQGNPSSQKGAMTKESYKKIIDEFLLKKGTGNFK